MSVVTAELYSDINKKTPLEKSRIINVDSIKNSISNILNINGKDLLFDFSPIDLENFLFNLYDDTNSYSLFVSLMEKLSAENRIEVDMANTQVIADPVNQSYTITIPYTIKGINLNQVISFQV